MRIKAPLLGVQVPAHDTHGMVKRTKSMTAACALAPTPPEEVVSQLVNKISCHWVNKFSKFHREFPRFDSILEELQDSLYHHCHANQEDFHVYVKAQLTRDSLFRLVRSTQGYPDESDSDDFDTGSREVVRTR